MIDATSYDIKTLSGVCTLELRVPNVPYYGGRLKLIYPQYEDNYEVTESFDESGNILTIQEVRHFIDTRRSLQISFEVSAQSVVKEIVLKKISK